MYIGYLKYVLRHKWFVFLASIKYGIVWQGIIHDWHKFLPDEFIPYARHFRYGIQTGRNKTGYYKPTDTGDPEFEAAWFRHQKRAAHHWQYWVIPEFDGCKPISIPTKYMLEMVCDWIGAGQAQGKPDILKWYADNKSKMVIENNSRIFIEGVLSWLSMDSYLHFRRKI